MKSKAQRTVDRLWQWSLFTLFFSVFPLFAVAMVIRAKGHHPTLEELLGTGELLSICCALSVVAIADVLVSKRNKTARLTMAFVSLIVVCCTIVWYAFVGYEIHMQEAYDKELVVSGSMLLYCVSAISAGLCVGLADEK
jgi:drug/metabolite transporter (DMT)-like permease